MSSISKILVGKIVAPQGLRGEVRVQTFTENPSDFAKLDIVVGSVCLKPTVVKGDLGTRSPHHPLQIKFVRAVPNSDVIIARVDGIEDRRGAEFLRGTELYIERDTLPPLPSGEYYQADLIGMTVFLPRERGGEETLEHSDLGFRSGEKEYSQPHPSVSSSLNSQETLSRPACGAGFPTVAAVHNFGAGDILELDNGEMVSFMGAEVDMAKRIITIKG